jgi:hypothetical protein
VRCAVVFIVARGLTSFLARPISFPFVGQQLWLKELESYIEFPPLQDPASYNLFRSWNRPRRWGTGTRANDREESPTIDGRRSLLLGDERAISEIAKTDAIDPCGHLTGEWSAVNRSVAS